MEELKHSEKEDKRNPIFKVQYKANKESKESRYLPLLPLFPRALYIKLLPGFPLGYYNYYNWH